jgi:hypothetical protein
MAKSSLGDPPDNPPVTSGERPLLAGGAGARMREARCRISEPRGNAAGARPPWRRAAMALMLSLCAMASAHAQIGGGHGHRQRDQRQTPSKSQAPTPLPAVPEIWPRLEEGAFICKSRDDLVRYQTQNASRANATTAGQTSECHAIGKLTGIRILDHDGPSRTQIVTTDESKETGWTNSYLPSTPPPSVAKNTATRK